MIVNVVNAHDASLIIWRHFCGCRSHDQNKTCSLIIGNTGRQLSLPMFFLMMSVGLSMGSYYIQIIISTGHSVCSPSYAIFVPSHDEVRPYCSVQKTLEWVCTATWMERDFLFFSFFLMGVRKVSQQFLFENSWLDTQNIPMPWHPLRSRGGGAVGHDLKGGKKNKNPEHSHTLAQSTSKYFFTHNRLH